MAGFPRIHAWIALVTLLVVWIASEYISIPSHQHQGDLSKSRGSGTYKVSQGRPRARHAGSRARLSIRHHTQSNHMPGNSNLQSRHTPEEAFLLPSHAPDNPYLHSSDLPEELYLQEPSIAGLLKPTRTIPYDPKDVINTPFVHNPGAPPEGLPSTVAKDNSSAFVLEQKQWRPSIGTMVAARDQTPRQPFPQSTLDMVFTSSHTSMSDDNPAITLQGNPLPLAIIEEFHVESLTLLDTALPLAIIEEELPGASSTLQNTPSILGIVEEQDLPVAFLTPAISIPPPTTAPVRDVGLPVTPSATSVSVPLPTSAELVRRFGIPHNIPPIEPNALLNSEHEAISIAYPADNPTGVLVNASTPPGTAATPQTAHSPPVKPIAGGLIPRLVSLATSAFQRLGLAPKDQPADTLSLPYSVTFASAPYCTLKHGLPWLVEIIGVYEPFRANGDILIPILTSQPDPAAEFFDQHLMCRLLTHEGLEIEMVPARSFVHVNGHGVYMNFAHHHCWLQNSTDTYRSLDAVQLVHPLLDCPAVGVKPSVSAVLAHLDAELPHELFPLRYASAVCLGPVIFKHPDAFGFIQWFAYHVDVLGIDHVYVYLVQPRDIPAAAAMVLRHYHARGKATLIDWSPVGGVGAPAFLPAPFLPPSGPSWCYMQPAKENDCLHRYRYASRYLMFFDADEFLNLSPPLHNVSDMLRYWEINLPYNMSSTIRWKNQYHSTSLGEGANLKGGSVSTTLQGVAEGKLGGLVTRMPLAKAGGVDEGTRQKWVARPERVHAAETHEVHRAERWTLNIEVDPQVVHHKHFYRLNDGFFGVANDWGTVTDTSWGLQYGPYLEDAMLKMSKNLTSS